MLFIFSTTVLIRHLWQLETVVSMHWCIISAVLLNHSNTSSTKKKVFIFSGRFFEATNGVLFVEMGCHKIAAPNQKRPKVFCPPFFTRSDLTFRRKKHKTGQLTEGCTGQFYSSVIVEASNLASHNQSVLGRVFNFKLGRFVVKRMQTYDYH